MIATRTTPHMLKVMRERNSACIVVYTFSSILLSWTDLCLPLKPIQDVRFCMHVIRLWDVRCALPQRTATTNGAPITNPLPQQLCPRHDYRTINTPSLLWSDSSKFFTAIITRSIFLRLRDRLFWAAFQLSSFEFVWLSTAAWLAPLGEGRSAEREFMGSNPGLTNTKGL